MAGRDMIGVADTIKVGEGAQWGGGWGSRQGTPERRDVNLSSTSLEALMQGTKASRQSKQRRQKAQSIHRAA